jgi:hypothetical protein
MESYDWLDLNWLLDRLLELAPADFQLAEPLMQELPVRLSGEPTARQRRLLEALLGLLEDLSFVRTLDRDEPSGARNALRLYA